MKKPWFKLFNWLLFAGAGVLLVGWSLSGFSAADRNNIVQALRNANYFWVFLSILFAILSHLSRAARWQMLLAPIGARPSLPNAFMAVMVGYLGNLALPRLGEFVRCAIISRYSDIKPERAIGTVLTERAVDTLCLAVATCIMLLTQFGVLSAYFNEKIATPMRQKYANMLSGNQLLSNLLLLGILLVLGLATWWLSHRFRQTFLYERLSQLVHGLWQGIISIRKLSNIPLFVGHSIFIWCMYFAMVYVCFFATEATQHLGFGAGIAVLVFGSLGFIATQGGIGAYQLAVTGVLTLYAVPRDLGYAFSWLAWSAQTVLVLAAGLYSMAMMPLVNQKRHHTAADDTDLEDLVAQAEAKVWRE